MSRKILISDFAPKPNRNQKPGISEDLLTLTTVVVSLGLVAAVLFVVRGRFDNWLFKWFESMGL